MIMRLLGRLVLPFFIKRYLRKKQSQYSQQFNKNTEPLEKEGSVTIKTKPKKSKSDTTDMGEYVDFEEVDE